MGEKCPTRQTHTEGQYTNTHAERGSEDMGVILHTAMETPGWLIKCQYAQVYILSKHSNK